MDPETAAQIDRLEEQYRRDGGPYARPYAGELQEVISTDGELFEGKEGSEGLEWLKLKHREIYDLLCRETGRDPG